MRDTDIAVIGMAGRFPGSRTLAEYWANLRGGVESIRSLSDDELLAAGVSAAELSDPSYVKACPVLDDVAEFDAAFFGFNPRDAAVMDPAHRLFLEVAWEAIEHAGRTALPDDGIVGVFAGSGAPYYLMDHVRRDRQLMRSMGEFLARHTGNDMNFLATRVSYEMDLRGPSVNVQTACSSALVAIHMACDSIRKGECTIALAGASTVIIPDHHGYVYHEGEIASPDGHCRPFDARSAGTVFGSGSGCVVLKKLSAALDDGDVIHAVIKGSAINNDGALRVGYLAPGVEGQAAVVAKALDQADVSADSITYIEAHGTGTLVGDPIEVTALNQAYRDRTDRRRYCAIGSVKSNIGHLGEAAGIASFIKAVLALEHREIPPSLGYETPNPQIDFDDSPFFVNDTLRSWSGEGPLRCGITSLGAGGTNCHVILEQAPEPISGEGARDAQLFVLSAKTSSALENACDRLAQAIEEDPSLDLADAAYTLAVGRRALPHRSVLSVRDREDAVAQLRKRNASRVFTQRADDSPGRLVFMFPGGGAQYARMGVELYERESVYRAGVDECLAVANPEVGRDLGALMFALPENAQSATRTLERPSLSLPALFTTEYAMAKLFESWGVEPAALVGHSMGEYVAACLAGVMTLEQALRLVMLRGRLFEKVDAGRMLSVSLSEHELRPLMPPGLDIAAVNAPDICTVSGPVALMETFEEKLADRGIELTRVRIDVAAHSAMLDPVLDEFRTFCRTIPWREPKLPLVSNLTGRWLTAAEATDPEYWVRHLRSTVRFSDCLETVRAGGDCVMVEVGPGRTLMSLARAQAVPVRHAFNTIHHPDEPASDLEYALTTLGRIWSTGIAVEWPALYDEQLRNRVVLPTYAWDHERYWIDAPANVDEPTQPKTSASRRDNVDDWFERPTWRQTVPPPPIATSSERVLVFIDAAGFGESIAATLEHDGRRVARVSAGASWNQRGDRFTVRPSVVADYENLLKAVASSGGFPTRVVHAWGVTEGARATPLPSALEYGFHSLLSFAQALSAENPDATFTLDVVTNNLQRVAGEELLDPGKALALGPARVMPREFSNVRTRSIDVVLPSSPSKRATLAALVAAEIAANPVDEIVAFRGRDRFAQVLESIRLDTVANRLREGGVYVITGGLGGIGYTLAEHLARTRRAKLLLIGRGATPLAAKEKVAALEALGSVVEVAQADVTNITQLGAALAKARQRFGAINGVFHAAGTLGDSLMALKTRDDAERVLAPKVQGTLALDAALGDTKLDVFVLFSSVSSIAGLAGQADYTAANAFLDAFAQERSARDGSFVVSVGWSGWRDTGMAANIARGAGEGGGIGLEVHPVLGKRLWASADAELFAAELSPAEHWVLGEHRLRSGVSLMPGTGHVELARAALESRPESRPLEIRDLAFISAFVANDLGPREMRVHIARTGGGSASLAIAGRSGDDTGWQEHVTATVGYIDEPRPAPLDLAAISARCTVREDTFTGAEESPHMRFGPRWKNLRAVRYGRGEALGTLELSPPFANDVEVFRLHPALLDMATSCAEGLIDGFDLSRDFYVPLSYTRLRMFGGMPARVHSHVRLSSNDFDSKELIVFNVTIADDAGNVLVDIEDYVMTRVTDTSQLEGIAVGAQSRAGRVRAHANFDPPVAPSNPPPLVAWMGDAIRSSEGMRAMDLVLAGPAVSHVFATPKPVAIVLEDLRMPLTEQAATGAKPAPTLPTGEIEAALAGHEAVHECVVMQRPNRPGELKLVAYVSFQHGEHATVTELRRFLKSRLAPQLVPSTFVDLDALPRATDGTVDRAALPDPFGAADDFVAPRTESERVIAEIWKEVLGVERISAYDNFFDVGGHSLLAVRVVVRIDKKLGVRLNQAVMVLQTLEQIAAECDKRRAAVQAPAATPAAAPSKGGFGRRLVNALKGE